MCDIAEILGTYPKKHKKPIADQLGMAAQTLQRQLNPYDPDTMPVTSIISFIRACNNDFTVLDHIENRLGRVAISIPSKTTELDYTSIAPLAKASGGAISEFAKAIEDKKITKEEAKDCLRELSNMTAVAMGLIQELPKIIE